MEDKFFTQKCCSRCSHSLAGGRTLSMFNEECICIKCSQEEKKDKDYKKAVDVDNGQIKQGNLNYKGIMG